VREAAPARQRRGALRKLLDAQMHAGLDVDHSVFALDMGVDHERIPCPPASGAFSFWSEPTSRFAPGKNHPRGV